MKEEFYNIERILDRRKVKGNYEYKVKWEGYPMNQCTWEPIKNLENVRILIEQYDKAHPIMNDVEDTPKKKGNYNRKKKINEDIAKENNDIQKTKKEKDNMAENNEENTKVFIYENENSYKVDNKLKNVITVKKVDGQLTAVVSKLQDNGEIIKTYIPTEELRKIKPWSLLKIYESKIKFI